MRGTDRHGTPVIVRKNSDTDARRSASEANRRAAQNAQVQDWIAETGDITWIPMASAPEATPDRVYRVTGTDIHGIPVVIDKASASDALRSAAEANRRSAQRSQPQDWVAETGELVWRTLDSIHR